MLNSTSSTEFRKWNGWKTNLPFPLLLRKKLPPSTKEFEDTGADVIDPIEYWSGEGSWPKEYFEQKDTIEHPLARKKSFRGKESVAGSISSSSALGDERTREKILLGAKIPSELIVSR